MAAPSKNASGATRIDPAALPDSRFFVIFGSDDFLVSKNAKIVADALCPEAERDFGLEIIDPPGATVADALQAIRSTREALQTMGFFGGQKVVWLKDATFLNDARTMQSEDVKEHLAEFQAMITQGIGEGSKLLLSCGKLDKRLSFFKACKAAGHLVEFSRPDKASQLESHARDQAAAILREAGITIRGELIQALVMRAGTDTRQLTQEIEKLALYVGPGGKVTLDDIETIVSPAREAIGWDLADAVALRDLPRALKIARQLLFQNEKIVGLMFLLESRFRELLVMKQCLHRGYCRLQGDDRYATLKWRDDAEVDGALAHLGRRDPRKMHPYRAKLQCEQAQGFSRRELLNAADACLQVHERVVSTGLPPGIQIELLLVRLLAQRTTAG